MIFSEKYLPYIRKNFSQRIFSLNLQQRSKRNCMKTNKKQEYRRQNAAWLAEKSLEPGVRPLGGGVLCKTLKEGSADRPSPTADSVVTVGYSGRTIDGHIFDKNEGEVPAAFRVRELIPGFALALQNMHPGERCEVYIPAEEAYGKFSQPGIPAFSTLIFDITLHSVM